MNDDLNTAVVIAHMNEELRKLNSSAPEKSKTEEYAIATAAWEQAGKILGLFSLTPEEFDKQLFKIKNSELGPRYQ